MSSQITRLLSHVPSHDTPGKDPVSTRTAGILEGFVGVTPHPEAADNDDTREALQKSVADAIHAQLGVLLSDRGTRALGAILEHAKTPAARERLTKNIDTLIDILREYKKHFNDFDCSGFFEIALRLVDRGTVQFPELMAHMIETADFARNAYDCYAAHHNKKPDSTFRAELALGALVHDTGKLFSEHYLLGEREVLRAALDQSMKNAKLDTPEQGSVAWRRAAVAAVYESHMPITDFHETIYGGFIRRHAEKGTAYFLQKWNASKTTQAIAQYHHTPPAELARLRDAEEITHEQYMLISLTKFADAYHAATTRAERGENKSGKLTPAAFFSEAVMLRGIQFTPEAIEYFMPCMRKEICSAPSRTITIICSPRTNNALAKNPEGIEKHVQQILIDSLRLLVPSTNAQKILEKMPAVIQDVSALLIAQQEEIEHQCRNLSERDAQRKLRELPSRTLEISLTETHASIRIPDHSVTHQTALKNAI